MRAESQMERDCRFVRCALTGLTKWLLQAAIIRQMRAHLARMKFIAA
jgi:hypothetical protein